MSDTLKIGRDTSTTLKIEGGTEIRVNTPQVMYIKIGNKIVYIDDSTGQLHIDAWDADNVLEAIPTHFAGKNVYASEDEL